MIGQTKLKNSRKPRKDGYMKRSKQKGSKILSFFNCIPKNLLHFVAEPTPGGIFK